MVIGGEMQQGDSVSLSTAQQYRTRRLTIGKFFAEGTSFGGHSETYPYHSFMLRNMPVRFRASPKQSHDKVLAFSFQRHPMTKTETDKMTPRTSKNRK
jgi:hypothetical protein